jgi:hypothetical protein
MKTVAEKKEIKLYIMKCVLSADINTGHSLPVTFKMKFAPDSP